MSSSIWTRCAGDSEVRALELDAWRVVEAQHQVSTRKLVDSAVEQELLEQLIDSVKPPAVAPRMHYLLFTPFRYPPLRHGSRFGTLHDRGIWYGSIEQPTAFAEVAYYRLLFLEGTTADLGAIHAELTAFVATIRASRAIDLTAAPFNTFRSVLASPTSYVETQALGSSLRGALVECVQFFCARSTDDGVNVAVLSPAAFGKRQPRSFETWHSVATRDYVEFTRRDYFEPRAHTFPRSQFLVGGVFPQVP